MLPVQVTATESYSTSNTPTATGRMVRSASAGTTPRGGAQPEPATPRSAAHAQDDEHRRWLEDLRAQYGHPAVTGARCLCTALVLTMLIR